MLFRSDVSRQEKQLLVFDILFSDTVSQNLKVSDHRFHRLVQEFRQACLPQQGGCPHIKSGRLYPWAKDTPHNFICFQLTLAIPV